MARVALLAALVAAVGLGVPLDPPPRIELDLQGIAGLTAYDTKIAVDMHRAGQPDHLGAAAALFMNFSNLFSRFMHIFASMDD